MGDLGNLLKRTTIPFEKPLTEEGIKKLFNYLADKNQGTIRYIIEKKAIISFEPELTEKQEYITELRGSICSNKNPMRSAFTTIREPLREEHNCFIDNFNFFYGLRFDAAGYDREEEVPRHDLEMINE